MNYRKQNFVSGQTLTAEHMNHIEDGIATVYEEIAELKDASTVSVTDKVVSISAPEGVEMTVDANTDKQVSLIHQGKNFCPSGLDNVPNYNARGVTITANADGSATLKGTATGNVGYYLAGSNYGTTMHLLAGTYTVTMYIDGEIAVGKNNTVISTEKELPDGTAVPISGTSVHAYSRSATFTLNEPTDVRSLIYVQNGMTVDCTVSVQYELGDTSTEYEPCVKNKYNTALPITVNALKGANVLYTTTGDVITCSYKTDNRQQIVDDLKNLLYFDPTPYGLPILHLSGNTDTMSKDDAVTLDYTFGALAGTCTCKWQGSSSIRYPKKNYTIVFDRSFEVVEGWGAQSKYCFKANFIDPTHSRNIAAARLWGQIVASRATVDNDLAACPNYGAIDGFPCVIMFNGKFHGLYTWNIPKDGWMFNFPANGATQECILCANGTDANGSEAFKATEAALGTGFDVEYITDENNAEWALASLNNLISACMASDGSDIDTTLSALIDWDSVVDYFCFTAAFGNYDGLIKNYLLYTRDGVKWHVGPYDLDCLWGNWWDGSKYIHIYDGARPSGIMSSHKLFDLAGKYKSGEIKARYKALRNVVLRVDNVATEIANTIGSIPAVVFAEDYKAWPTIKRTSVDGYAQIVDWYRSRIDLIDEEIELL